MAVEMRDYRIGNDLDVLAGLLPLALLLALQRDRQDVARALLQRPGDPDPIIEWHHDAEEFFTWQGHERPNVALFRQGARWMLVIRGTTNAGQWVRHLTGSTGLEYELPGYAMAHGFFLRVERDLSAWLDAALPADKGAVERLYVCGHSFGGGLAHLVANRMREKYPDLRVHVFTFGEPRAVTTGYEGRKPQQHLRYVNQGDIVPHIPFGSITVVNIAGAFNKTVTWLSRFLGASNYVTSVLERYAPRAWRHYGEGRWLTMNGQAIVLQSASPGSEISAIFTPEWYEGHLTDTGYWPRLKLVWQKRGSPARYKEVIAAGDLVITGDPLPVKPVVLPPPSAADEQGARSALGFDPSNGPSWAEIESAETVYLAATVTNARKSGNVSESFGEPEMASGLWKATWTINWSEYGKSESVCVVANTRQEAHNKVKQLLTLYSTCMGSDRPTNLPGDDPPTVGGPIIQKLRIQDALNTKESQLYTVPGNVGGTYSMAEGNKPADNPFYGIMVRLQSQYVAGGITYVNRRPFTFHGFPDDVIQGGRYVGSAVTIRTNPSLIWHKAARDVLLYLTLPANQFGHMVHDPAVTGYWADTFQLDTDGNAICTAPGHNFQPGDKVKLTKSNTPGLAGTFTVDTAPGDVVKLLGLRLVEQDLPDYALLTRVRRADGTWHRVFSQFVRAEGDYASDQDFLIVDRKPGKRIPLLASRRKKCRRRG